MSGRPASWPAAGPAETRVIAFLAGTSLTGRTNVVSNLAWMLARAGRRVLVVDAGRGAVRVHEHLRMFHIGESPVTDHLPAGLASLVFALPGLAGTQPELRGYAAPPGRLHVVWIPETAAWPSVAELGGVTRSDLRRQLRFTEYDYVLLDPADSADVVAQWLAVLCDVVVVCFPHRSARLADAVAVAGQVHRAAPAGVRIIATATGMNENDPGRIRSRAEAVRAEFLGALDEPALGVDFAQVDLPGNPSGQPLAPLLEESPHRDRLLAAYGELVRLVTDGELRDVPPEPETARSRYRYGLARQAAEESGDLFLAHPPPQRPWADWLRAELSAVGLPVRPWNAADASRRDGAVTVLALAPDGDPDDRWLAGIAEAVRARGDAELVLVRTSPEAGADDPETPGALASTPAGVDRVVDLTGCPEETARQRLRGTLGLAVVSTVPAERSWRAGFPSGRSTPPREFRVLTPPRLFVGRDRELGELRDLLLAGREAEPVGVCGPVAAGKTYLVREYVRRFRWDYGLIVWVAAGSRHEARSALAELSDELGVEPRGHPAQELLHELSRRPEQWLMVFDGADHQELAGLLPPVGTGHVVLTCRADAPGPAGERAVTLGALTEPDAVRLLTSQVEGLSPGPAAAVVGTVGALPLDLRLAAGLLGQAGILLHARRAITESRAADAAVPAFRAAVAPSPSAPDEPALPRIVRVALALMGEELSGRIAVVLAQLCAFVAPTGISLALVQSRPMRNQVAAGLSAADAALLRADGWEMDRALAFAARFRLVDVVWGGGGMVRMHPAVQAALLDGMTDVERAARREQLLRGLAASSPRTVAAASAPRRELHQHLVSSGALDVTGPDDVRRWLVEQLEHLIARGDGEVAEALRLWRPMLDRWLDLHGWDDRLTLRLATRLADVTRALGRSGEALELSREVLRHSASLLGPQHPRVLVTRRGMAGDLRGLGKFRPALIEDQTTWRGFRDQFGNSHPETLIAAHNLANSYHLAGRTDEAARVGLRTRARRLRLFAADNPDTLWLTSDIGLFLAELGELDESRRLLDDAYRRRLGGGGQGDEDTLLLRIIRSLAVTDRRREQLPRAKDLNSRAYLALRRLLGEDNPRTRSCRLSLAVDYHLAGESEDAVRLAEESLAGYERDLGPAHPFTHLGRSLRAVLVRGAGDVEEAVVDGEKAATGLTATLGESHPWTLGGLVNQAGNLASARRAEQAEQCLRAVVEQGRDLLGPGHPYLQTARRLLAAVISDGEISGGHPHDGVPFHFVDMEVPET
ncbi:FxSxx-COOH system tetratricopeptide repeat protein [Micromonospora sp. RTGN7]|uniref:FxSxx-COOH system tetratricopeptide repeat protein n=1 Tax=Micromonospora sp. RTGN7 TaxID=3016526 RepID=UPI0029FF40AC|nr:FxSxx-COOH system tetratricopeptide repeat protein [Micromonospora sp. RTGN7]